MDQIRFHTHHPKHRWVTLIRLAAIVLTVVLPSVVHGSSPPSPDFQDAPPVVEAVLDELDVDYVVIGQRAGKLYGIKDAVYWSCGDEVRILDERSLEIDTLHTGFACSVAVDDMRNRTYVDDGPNGILVLDGASNAVIATISTGADTDGGAVAANPDHGTIYSAEGHGMGTTFDIVDATTYETITFNPMLGDLTRHNISTALEDGFVFTGGYNNSRLSIRDAETGVQQGYIQDVAIHTAQYNANHDEIWVITPVMVRVFDVHTQALTHVKFIDNGHFGATIQIDERRDRVYVYDPGASIGQVKATVYEYDADTGEVIQEVDLGQGLGSGGPMLALNARAGRLYAVVNGVERRLIVYDLRGSDKASAVAELRLSSGTSVATNPQNGRVYVYGQGPTTVLFDPIAFRRNRLALLDELAATASALGLHHGIENSLLAKLNTASLILGDLQESNDHAAASALAAFIHQAEAQSGKKIPTDDANVLIEAAEEIIGLIDGDGQSGAS